MAKVEEMITKNGRKVSQFKVKLRNGLVVTVKRRENSKFTEIRQAALV